MTDKTYQLHVRNALIGRLSCNHGELGQVFECFIKVLQGWLYMNEDEIDRIGITCLKTYIMMASCNSLLITSSLGGSFCLGVKMYFLSILSVDGLVSLPYLVAKSFIVIYQGRYGYLQSSQVFEFGMSVLEPLIDNA